MTGQVRVRAAPPSPEPNNQDVFIWALYLLGGADRDIDVEAVYLKSFELAPARLGWRTRPDLPDYKKTAKALQSVEAKTHVGLVQKSGAYFRRLTAEGARWVEQYRVALEAAYSGKAPVAAASTNEHQKRRRSLKESRAFEAWVSGDGLELLDLADALDCTGASPASVWRARVTEVRRAADVLQDEELATFSEQVHQFLSTQVGGYA
ncbi:MAG: hypothetical protein F2840_06620 [Actinobacteria bacterium]|uniref:Unannotated protein n=1 Tax=freshwater metagenome TaxID=449393 RepID=A0A6J7JVZ5_9ZZZZ|nr:hypothetical protein [Actinomycetota bacterium]